MVDGFHTQHYENVLKHIEEHRRLLEVKMLLYDFIELEKESFDAFDDDFFELLEVGDVISINVAENPVFNEDNVYKIESFKDPKTPVLIGIEDLYQTWASMYKRELDEHQKRGIQANNLKLYKIKKSNSLKFIFSE